MPRQHDPSTGPPDDAADRVRQTRDGLAALDPVLQHRTRLGACVLLSGADAFSFSRLRELLEETDGNLGAQLRKLEDAGYVAVRKEFVDRRPVSWYGLTSAGGRALRAHLAALEALIGAAGNGADGNGA
jgi:DNA-binding transcriptional ArsR family regulator